MDDRDRQRLGNLIALIGHAQAAIGYARAHGRALGNAPMCPTVDESGGGGIIVIPLTRADRGLTGGSNGPALLHAQGGRRDPAHQR